MGDQGRNRQAITRSVGMIPDIDDAPKEAGDGSDTPRPPKLLSPACRLVVTAAA